MNVFKGFRGSTLTNPFLLQKHKNKPEISGKNTEIQNSLICFLA